MDGKASIAALLRELGERLQRVGVTTWKVGPWFDLLELTAEISGRCKERWSRKSIELDLYPKSPFGESLVYHAWDPITSDSQMGAIPTTEKFAYVRTLTLPVFLDFVGRWERFARLNENEPRISTVERGQTTIANRNRKRTANAGRNKAKISKEEKTILADWQNRNRQFVKTHNDLDDVLDLEPGTVKATLDRLRARDRRDRQTTKRTK